MFLQDGMQILTRLVYFMIELRIDLVKIYTVKETN
jgi:hypothetical protein